MDSQNTKVRPETPAGTPGPCDYARAALLREALASFVRTSEQITRVHGLTLQRYQLLLMVKTARDGGELASLVELGERLQLAQNSVVGLVHRAESLGLVRRELSPTNRRYVYVELTEEGARRLAEAVTALGRARDRLGASIADLAASA